MRPQCRLCSTTDRRGLDSKGCDRFIVDRAQALSKALRRTFGADIPIQRCQTQKPRNITDRLAPKHRAALRRALKQAWELNNADKTERPHSTHGILTPEKAYANRTEPIRLVA